MDIRRKPRHARRFTKLPSYAKKWQPKETEMVPYHPSDNYGDWLFEGEGGRAKKSKGELSLRVARKFYRDRGFTVLASEPRLGDEGFVLLSYPGYRTRNHPTYAQMVRIFGRDPVEELIAVADAVKIYYTGNRSGGDPDLFVFKGNGRQEHFFVEAKNRDKLIDKQKLCFPLIERFLNCEVKVAQLNEMISRK